LIRIVMGRGLDGTTCSKGTVWTSIADQVSRKVKKGLHRSASESGQMGRLTHHAPPLEDPTILPPNPKAKQTLRRGKCGLFVVLLCCVITLKFLADHRFFFSGCAGDSAECCAEALAERTVYRGGSLSEGWKCSLQHEGGQRIEKSLVGPLQVSVPSGSSLWLETSDAFPSIRGVVLRLRGGGLGQFALLLHSWDRRHAYLVGDSEMDVSLREGWAEVIVAFKCLEWRLWAGLEFRNAGERTALLALDALSLKLPSAQQMLRSQVGGPLICLSFVHLM
jgi:hypothetical protein